MCQALLWPLCPLSNFKADFRLAFVLTLFNMWVNITLKVVKWPDQIVPGRTQAAVTAPQDLVTDSVMGAAMRMTDRWR